MPEVTEVDSLPSKYLRFFCEKCGKNTIGIYESDRNFFNSSLFKKFNPNYKERFICSQCGGD